MTILIYNTHMRDFLMAHYKLVQLEAQLAVQLAVQLAPRVLARHSSHKRTHQILPLEV